jgi:hypothetical protein
MMKSNMGDERRFETNEIMNLTVLDHFEKKTSVNIHDKFFLHPFPLLGTYLLCNKIFTKAL